MAEPISTHEFSTPELLGALALRIDVEANPVKLKTKQGILTVEVYPPAPPKGGDLSRRAAMLCSNKGFQKFLEVADEGKAKATIYAICGVTSRAQIDHEELAASAFRGLDEEYNQWLNPPF